MRIVLLFLFASCTYGLDFRDPFFGHKFAKGTDRIEMLPESVRKHCCKEFISAYVFGSAQLTDSIKFWIVRGTMLNYNDAEPPVGTEDEAFPIIIVSSPSKCESMDMNAGFSLPKRMDAAMKTALEDTNVIHELSEDVKRRLVKAYGGPGIIP